MNTTPVSLLKIKQLYPSFTGNYISIADHILAHPETVVQNKVRDIAECCNCDDAQIIRFCQKIGYKGFSELKATIAADFIRTAPAPSNSSRMTSARTICGR